MKRKGYKLIEMAVEYLHAVFGVTCAIQNNAGQPEGIIDTEKCLLMAVGEMPDGSTLAKRVGDICNLTGRRGVLVLENIDTVRRRALIAGRTCFVVPGKQAYLPFLGALLTERGLDKAVTNEKHFFSPAAQVLLLTHLQKEPLDGMIISEIAKKFPYSVKTVSSAAKELELAGVCTLEGDNSGKYLHFIGKEEIWDMAYPWLASPVQEVLYCDSMEQIPQTLRFVTYDKALAEYTFMADFSGEAFAVFKNDDTIKRLKSSGTFNPVEGKYRVKLWKYNPALLAKDGMVDALSLALCYKDSDDERVTPTVWHTCLTAASGLR